VDETPNEDNCFICAKHRGDIAVPGGPIYQDELVYVGHRAPPGGGSNTYLGYVMVETRRHASGLSELTRPEARAVGEWVAQIARALTAVVQAEHVYAFVLGDHVPHFHEHVVARYASAPREFWGMRADEWPAAPRGDAQAVTSVCERLRGWLASTPPPPA
jgi:histidine triad (HIT) family protein